MLNQVIGTILGVMVRVVLLLAGLVFLASVLTAAALLLAVWLVRAFWAKLTGQAVSPWTFQVSRQAMWNRFYRRPGPGGAARRDASDVIDVEIREIREIKPPER